MEDVDEIDEKEKTPVEKLIPVKVLYCGVCGLPAEFCEFGTNFEKCKPWLLQNCPDLYPQLNEEGKKEEEEESKDKEGKSSKRGGKALQKPEKDGDVQLLPGGKVKKAEKPIVYLSRVQRNKKKYITVVSGLDKFGIKLTDAARVFAKKFSCGASVIKGAEEEIDVQGDIIDEMVDFLEEKWEISEDSIVVNDKAKKRT